MVRIKLKEIEAARLLKPPSITPVQLARVRSMSIVSVGIFSAIAMLLPLAFIPGLIAIILPSEVYVISRIYDEVVVLRSPVPTETQELQWEFVEEETEKGRIATYGAHTVP
ncbi:MAG: hypothetical protein ACFE7R_07220 [Candidatus Hodarchaeota archaeon]